MFWNEDRTTVTFTPAADLEGDGFGASDPTDRDASVAMAGNGTAMTLWQRCEAPITERYGPGSYGSWYALIGPPASRPGTYIVFDNRSRRGLS
jgi:hypothetical protein